MARSYNEIYAIEIVSRDAKLEEALLKITQLEEELLMLRVQLSDKAVVLISECRKGTVKTLDQE